MTAWVLIIFFGSLPMTISNIESENECQRLAHEIYQSSLKSAPENFYCKPYRAAYRF